jgi:hypothetical protein
MEASGKPINISLVSPTIKSVQANYDLQDCLKDYLTKSKLMLASAAESGFDVSFELDPKNLSRILFNFNHLT